MKVVKKALIVEAVQFNQLGDHPKVKADANSATGYSLITLEHTTVPFEVTLGDWIITGNHNDTWAVKDRIFRDTYERPGTSTKTK